MSNDLVVQLGAKLDQFASDMNQAGDMADSAVSRIEQSFASLNPAAGGFGSLATVFTGAVGSVVGLLAALQKVNGELADIAKNAEFVGVSVERFQQIQFAAGQSGVSNSQSTTDLSNVAKLLADAKYNENSLTKLLDENNIKYKDRNGQIISLNQLLTIAGGLLGKFDSIPDKTKAAQMLGLSQGWVGALHDGSDAFNKIASSANDAGAVIDSQTVAKAAAFDKAWKQSSDLLSRQFKAAAGDVAVVLDGLIDKANDFFNTLAKSNGGQVGDGQSKFDRYATEIDIARRESLGLTQDVEELTNVIDYMTAKGGDPDIIRGLQAAREEAQKTTEFIRQVNEMEAKKQFPGGVVPLPTARPAAADKPTGDGKLPQRGGAGGKDQFDIATDSVTKHIATINADTAAVFQNNAAQASLRAEFQELTAIMRDGGEVTQTQIDAYEKLRQSMTAQQALTAAGITLTKEHSAAFLSTSQNIGTATTAYDAAKLKLTQLNSASSQVGSALSAAFSDAIVEGKSLSDVLTGLLQTLEKAAINSVFTSLFNAPAAGGVSPVLSFLGIGHNAGGTDNWSGGPTWVGENGPEIVNLPRGAQVVPNAVAARQSSGGGSPIVYNIDASGADSGTVARIQSTLAAHARAIQGQGKAMQSAQRYQSTGVG